MTTTIVFEHQKHLKTCIQIYIIYNTILYCTCMFLREHDDMISLSACLWCHWKKRCWRIWQCTVYLQGVWPCERKGDGWDDFLLNRKITPFCSGTWRCYYCYSCFQEVVLRHIMYPLASTPPSSWKHQGFMSMDWLPPLTQVQAPNVQHEP